MKVILGVCGSISAYKAYDLLRCFVKEGHQVKVVLTKGAENFIKKETFTYLGAEEVYSYLDDFKIKKHIDSTVLHIDLKNWCDLILIAPASANTMAKLAAGFCDDLLTSIFLSAEAKNKLIFPAMNTQMLQNTITQENFKRLSLLQNIFIHPPVQGELICGETGSGKLPTPENIYNFSVTYPFKRVGKKVVITTGATIAPLDPVRYLTNPSSGKTGYELTKTYLSQGFEVCLIYGEYSQIDLEFLNHHPYAKTIKVFTTEDMYQAVMQEFPSCDIYISTAAISDIQFHPNECKIKKSSQETTIDFQWAKDILKEVLAIKKHQKIISFAAETHDLEKQFQKKFERKTVDLMIGNQVSNGTSTETKGFGTNENTYYFVQDGKIQDTQYLTKKELAKSILGYTEAP